MLFSFIVLFSCIFILELFSTDLTIVLRVFLLLINFWFWLFQHLITLRNHNRRKLVIHRLPRLFRYSLHSCNFGEFCGWRRSFNFFKIIVGRFERNVSCILSLTLTLFCFLSPVYLVIKAPHTEGMYRLTAPSFTSQFWDQQQPINYQLQLYQPNQPPPLSLSLFLVFRSSDSR